MSVGDISVSAFDAAGKVRADEQVEDAIDAVRRDALAAGLRHRVGDVIGRGRLIEASKRLEHRRAHLGPLFAALFHTPRRRAAQRLAIQRMVIVVAHGAKIGIQATIRNPAKGRVLFRGDVVEAMAKREDRHADDGE